MDDHGYFGYLSFPCPSTAQSYQFLSANDNDDMYLVKDHKTKVNETWKTNDIYISQKSGNSYW